VKVIAHPDPFVLERELLTSLAAARDSDPLAPLLVLVPTRRLADHVQRRLGEERSAWLNLEVVHFRALARRILEAGTVPPLKVASLRLRQGLLRAVTNRNPKNHWSRILSRRPGVLRRLAGALNDLREAGISPRDFEQCSKSANSNDLSALYAQYCDSLTGLLPAGWVDDTGMVEAALPNVPSFAERYATIFMHGAYELIGIHLELLQALDHESPVTMLLPAQPGLRVTQYAEQFARRNLLRDGEGMELLETPDGSTRMERLTALYDEESMPPAAEDDLFHFRHAQGAAAEARIAVRHAMQAVQEGCLPHEIVIAARSLRPYASALEQAFEDESLPWTSSLAAPLRRHPLIHDLILMLRVVAEDFPRRATAELLRSPRIRWSAILSGEALAAFERADLWSRRARIIGGLKEWTEDLTEWAGRPTLREDQSREEREQAQDRAAERVQSARRIGRALRALHDGWRPGRIRGWRQYADDIEARLGWLYAESGDSATAAAALDALRGLLDDMRGIALMTGDGLEVPFKEMLAWLESAVDGAECALHPSDGGGILVLDAMQLRGLTCKRLYLLGMNSGLFPRSPTPDPILTEELRTLLRGRTGRPLPVQSEAVEEERLLLALLLGSASERLEISWQRADEAGKAKSPSLALREIARVALGRPDLGTLVERAAHLPSHPMAWLETLERETGMLSPSEEMLLTILRGGGPDEPTIRGRFPELSHGLDMLRATESYAPGDAGYDAKVQSTFVPSQSH